MMFERRRAVAGDLIRVPWLKLALGVLASAIVLTACEHDTHTRTLDVVATAYTLSEAETKEGNIGLAAWGDQLEPGMKAIAVSRDLISMGLSHGTKVEIQGLEGSYTVLDKMNKRWTMKIDIFMGHDRIAARQWGKRQVKISWQASTAEHNSEDS